MYVKPLLRTFLFELQKRWKLSSRIQQKFLDKNSNWLDVFVSFEKEDKSPKAPKQQCGRPSSEFQECSHRTKRRKTAKLRTEAIEDELAYALQIKLRAAGKLHEAKIIQDIMWGSPKKAERYRQCMQYMVQKNFAADVALSLFIQLQFSKSQFQILRNALLGQKCTVLPSYKIIADAKKNCYPDQDSIIVTDIHAQVKKCKLF